MSVSVRRESVTPLDRSFLIAASNRYSFIIVAGDLNHMEAVHAVGIPSSDSASSLSSSPHSAAPTTCCSSQAAYQRLEQTLHSEQIYLAGWLWKQHHAGPHRSWRRKWVSCPV